MTKDYHFTEAESKMEVDSNFMTDFKKALEDGNAQYISAITKDDVHLQHIRDYAWDIIPLLTPFLSGETVTHNRELQECCEKVLSLITNEMSPDEAALQIVGEIGETSDETTFVTFLKVFQVILPRLSKKHASTLTWSFSAIRSFLSELELPEVYDLSDEELVLMDYDTSVIKIISVYEEILTFVRSFLKNTNEFSLQYQKPILIKFIVNIFEKPLVFLHLEVRKNTKNKARRIGEQFAAVFLLLQKDPIHLLEEQNELPYLDDLKLNLLGEAHLFYLIFVEETLFAKVPKVYNPTFVFHNCLFMVCQLFDNKNRIVVSKGLNLTRHLLNSLNGFELHYDLLDSESHSRFCKHLSNIIIYDNFFHHRKLALSLFETYLKSFDVAGRYLIIYNLVKFVNHGGFVGFLITQYKDMIDNDLKNSQISKHFCGDKLYALLKLFCHLHKAEETDLIEISDQIIAALNLLRYLAIRDARNATGVWDLFKTFDRVYLSPLKKGLVLSKAHYDLKLKEFKESLAEAKRKGIKDNNVSVTVAGEKLPEMPTEEKLKVLTSALTTFDVMESLLGRVTELIEAKNYNVV